MGNVMRLLCGATIAIILMITHSSLSVHASSNHYQEHNVQFQSTDNTVLNGSLLIPVESGPHPAVILIHGAGTHDREEYRAEAEIFTKSGIAAFIYDKRTVGYSADGIGEQSRSYSLLADDVLAAVHALHSWEELDQDNIGVWGLSEGGWVGPLAAVRSNDVAFVITVGASGVPPSQQTSWAMENEFRQQGITAQSFISSITRTGMRFLVSAGLFAEATYNPMPALEQLHQPLLAIWGSNDRTAPPLESYLAMQEALDQGGNGHYTFQFVPEANHMLRSSPDGFIGSEQFAEGYAEAMTSWIEEVINGEGLRITVIGDPPQQNYTSSAGIVELSWYDSAWLHLGILIMFVVLFSSYYGVALTRLFRRSKVKPIQSRLLWYARIVAISGIVLPLCFFGYFGYVMIANHPGSIIIGRPLPWLVIQLLSVSTCVFIVMLTLSWHYARSTIAGSEIVRLGLLIMGGMLFIPWALYWHLLSP